MVRGPSYTEQEAREAVAASRSIHEALRRLGICNSGGSHPVLMKWIERWGIPTDHFDPDAVRNEALASGRAGPRPLTEILVKGSTYPRGHLKRRLYDEGLKQRSCELCGQGEEWRGRRMALILDHANGDSTDNRIENLRIVCPNCAATLDTHCGRKNRLERGRECALCGKAFEARYAAQRFCSRECGSRRPRPGPRPELRRVERPPLDQLRREVALYGYRGTGRLYGVTDNAVRKWIRAHEAEAATVHPGPPRARAEDGSVRP